MAIQSAATSGGFIASHPGASFTLFALAALVLGILPVAIVRRLVVTPHPSDERARIRPRRWLRLLVHRVLPGAAFGSFVVMSVLAVRLADEVSVLAMAVALVFGLVTAAPFVGIAWAMRDLLDAGVRATDSGLFLMGSLVRWEEVHDMRMTRWSLELRTPDSLLTRRRTVSRVGWELDEDAVAPLERLWRAKAGGPAR